jgi:hypothetical protein
MKLRSFTLGTAALAGTLLFAAPGFAQQSPYDTNPTPAERAQTDRLNSNAADRAHGDADANATAQGNYDTARSNYDRDRQTYDAQRAAYERDRARYYRENPRRWDAFYGHSNFSDVLSMRSDSLVGLTVSTRGGNRVGRVRDVDSDHGRITRIAVSVGGGNVAWIDADDVRYDPGSRTVFTDLTRDQIDSLAHMRYPRF